MRFIVFLILCFSTLSTPVFSQILNPVKWTFDAKQVGDDEFDIIMKANIDKGWYVYSQHIGEGGPIPAEITFEKGSHYTLVGKNKEGGHMKKMFDKIFEMDLVKFKDEYTVTQRVKVNDYSKSIKGSVYFQTCDDEQCLPPTDVPFSLKLKAPVKKEDHKTSDATPVHDSLKKTAVSTAPDTSSALLVAEDVGPKIDSSKIGGTDTSELAAIYPISNIDIANPISKCSVTEALDTSTKKSIWNIFFLGFIGGLIALLTPCVFPLIPLTVSFFTKSNSTKKKGLTNAFIYGAFIIGVYLLLSVPFHLLDSINPNILNDISTNTWLNLAFFIIFIFFAFSFFGYYEITLPSGLTNKASKAEGVGGILGIFFMALTLALVSFSCTGPILGSLLAGALSSDGGAWQLTAGMGGFGLALALPFALFAAFPGWMNTLPKSGGWLNTVKVVLGFVELALAFKFLSNADLVAHWGLLKIEPFLIIWIICAIGLAAYLFGWLKFPHDSPIKKLSVTRIGLGLISAVFAVYMMTGFIYNDKTQTFTTLPLLSGLAPPVGYSIIHPNECPQNLNCFHDLKEGLAYAKQVNKPVFLDFTGYACVNCRKMEEHVWPDKEVYKLLSEKYVVVSLYVDDKAELPAKEQVTLYYKNGAPKPLKSVGDKWNYFQTFHFNNNSQPLYALIAADGTLLNSPVGYTPDPRQYEEFLKCGLDAFQQTQKTLIGSAE
jgi:thiol:disulfide interchange protein DsbD